MKQVLLISDGIFHPPFMARRVLSKVLKEMPDMKIVSGRSLEVLTRIDLNVFHAVVIYVHHKKISEKALNSLDGFVRSGGGLLGVHTATASFKDTPAYFEILGGRFIGHGPIQTFSVVPAHPEEGIFKGIDAFEVYDELYLHDLANGIEAQFISQHEGKDVPVVWTYHYGKGRVCYGVPGHRTESLRNPAYQEVLKRGMEWVCQR